MPSTKNPTKRTATTGVSSIKIIIGATLVIGGIISYLSANQFPEPAGLVQTLFFNFRTAYKLVGTFGIIFGAYLIASIFDR